MRNVVGMDAWPRGEGSKGEALKPSQSSEKRLFFWVKTIQQEKIHYKKSTCFPFGILFQDVTIKGEHHSLPASLGDNPEKLGLI